MNINDLTEQAHHLVIETGQTPATAAAAVMNGGWDHLRDVDRRLLAVLGLAMKVEGTLAEARRAPVAEEHARQQKARKARDAKAGDAELADAH
jgi:hypothetical protein